MSFSEPAGRDFRIGALGIFGSLFSSRFISSWLFDLHRLSLIVERNILLSCQSSKGVGTFQQDTMISNKSLLAIMALCFTSASAYNPQNGDIRPHEDQTALRGPSNRYEKDEERQTLFLCNLVEGLFEDDVKCTCNNRWLFGEIGFTCDATDYRCTDLPVTGDYCGKASLTGKMNWFIFQVKTTLTVQACEKSAWANNTVAGDIFVGDVCMGLGVTGRIVGSSGVSSCTAKFGDVTCDSCKSCKYDVPRTNRTGVELACNNLKVKPCFPVEVATFVSGREHEQAAPIDTLKTFRPYDVTRGPGMQYAMQLIEDKVAARRLNSV